MDLKERIKSLCKDNGISMNKLEDVLGFGKGYISKLNSSTPNTAKIKKIADYFGVIITYLLDGEDKTSQELTDRDERDISKDLDRIMKKIRSRNDGPLNYNGVEIDDASISMLENAIEFALRETKKENKIKYNPYKNKSR